MKTKKALGLCASSRACLAGLGTKGQENARLVKVNVGPVRDQALVKEGLDAFG